MIPYGNKGTVWDSIVAKFSFKDCHSFYVLLNFSVSILQKAGWRKWAAEHPDMYSLRPEAVVPHWYTRKVSDIEDSDTKRRLWTWEKTQKPTEKKAYGIKIEVRT